MAPKTKHKPGTTSVGEEVLDFVLPYIHDVDDRNSISLVSRKFYELDGITRKRLTIHTPYYPNPPASLTKRFPFTESLGLEAPSDVYKRQAFHNNTLINPWIEQIDVGFRCLKELYIHRMVVHDEDLETLARTRGKDLRTLKIKNCEGFSTDGLRHVAKYCNHLRTFSLGYCTGLFTDGVWFHQLALNSTVLEMFHSKYTKICEEDLTLLAKNCCNSLKSLKIGWFSLRKLGDVFRYAFRLEHFSGYNCDDESDIVGFQFPQHLCSISIVDLAVIRCSVVLPFLNHIRKLKLPFVDLECECQCLLFKRCPNLEVLYTDDICGDKGLQVIGQFCKKLRKLTFDGLVTHVGLIDLATGCNNLESLDVTLRDISNEAIKCLGTHLKNLRKFSMDLAKNYGTTEVPLDNGIRDMLMGCSKLEKLDIRLYMHGRLTDVGLEYIGKYGANLKSLSLTRTGSSDAGLVKFSEGCLKLRNLQLIYCPFSKQAVTSFVFNMPSLRYVWVCSNDHSFALVRPDFQL